MSLAARDWWALAGFLAGSWTVQGIASWLTFPAVREWYPTLAKPAWTPPSWVFGPVWTLLYILMAVAAWLVWRKAGFAGARLALVLYFVQLALNGAWSGFFFAMRNPAAGLADILLLWGALGAVMFTFAKISATAAWLLVPYLAWVSYAAALNFAIWQLNR